MKRIFYYSILQTLPLHDTLIKEKRMLLRNSSIAFIDAFEWDYKLEHFKKCRWYFKDGIKIFQWLQNDRPILGYSRTAFGINFAIIKHQNSNKKEVNLFWNRFSYLLLDCMTGKAVTSRRRIKLEIIFTIRSFNTVGQRLFDFNRVYEVKGILNDMAVWVCVCSSLMDHFDTGHIIKAFSKSI